MIDRFDSAKLLDILLDVSLQIGKSTLICVGCSSIFVIGRLIFQVRQRLSRWWSDDISSRWSSSTERDRYSSSSNDQSSRTLLQFSALICFVFQRAGLHPTAEQMEMFAYHLPKHSLSSLIVRWTQRSIHWTLSLCVDRRCLLFCRKSTTDYSSCVTSTMWNFLPISLNMFLCHWQLVTYFPALRLTGKCLLSVQCF